MKALWAIGISYFKSAVNSNLFLSLPCVLGFGEKGKQCAGNHPHLPVTQTLVLQIRLNTTKFCMQGHK